MFWRTSPVRCRISAAALLIMLFSSPLMSQQTSQPPKEVVLQVDHVSVCGANLDALRQMFADVGLAPDFGGPHGNGITQMAAVGFDDGTYIELIAPIKPGVTAGAPWAKYMSDEAVTCAWAVGTTDAAAEVDRLKKAGVQVSAPEHGNRKRPDGMSVEWMMAGVGSGTLGSTLPFFIEDLTPHAWRIQTSASVQGAPVGGVANVVVGVSNLEAAIALFRKAYGWAEPLTETQRDIGKLAYFPGEPVILATPTGGGWLSEHISKYGETPVAYLLSASDFGAAAKKYKLSGTKTWFGQRVGWFDERKLKGVRLGVIGQ